MMYSLLDLEEFCRGCESLSKFWVFFYAHSPILNHKITATLCVGNCTGSFFDRCFMCCL